MVELIDGWSLRFKKGETFHVGLFFVKTKWVLDCVIIKPPIPTVQLEKIFLQCMKHQTVHTILSALYKLWNMYKKTCGQATILTQVFYPRQ